MIAAQSLRFITNKAIIVWTSNSSFIPLDSGFRRNDGKEQCLKFVSPAKAGVQSRGLKRAVTQINDVYPIMDSLVNDLSHRIIGIAIEVHKKLGPGFQEKIYEEALLKEFEKSLIEFEKQKVIRVDYDGFVLGNQRIDLLVDGEIILEIKACTKIIPIYRDQLISYLKTTNKKLGLILNFGRRKLEIKRVVHNF